MAWKRELGVSRAGAAGDVVELLACSAARVKSSVQLAG